MQTRSAVVSLVVLAVCLAIAAPGLAQDTQPAPKSYVAIDPNGSIIECLDFNKKGVVSAWANGVKGNFQSLDVSGITGTAADSVYFGQIQNIVWEGFFASKLEFHGTCEAQGGSWWGFIPSWGNASCGFTSYMRFPIGKFNNSSSMIQVGPLFGNCDGLFGAAAPIQKGTRADK
jgi:hypothetical protein